MNKSQIGVIGLAVMGKNLAFNMANHGYAVAVYNRSEEKTKQLLAEAAGRQLTGAYLLQELVASLERPRKILIMVKAGSPVDATIEQLLPYLEQGDILIDGGNSFYQDTIRRHQQLAAQGIHFIGTGVSGGEEGALKGPAIMPGGDPQAYALVQPIFEAIAAKVGEDACCTYIGSDGAGHFVKMVHNGIEYADMQLICEAYILLKELLGLKPEEIKEIFAGWNQGELNSYLIEITADILGKTDPATGKPMVEVILDKAGQKGTGKWTSQVALDLGVPIPSITTAVFERYLSAMKDERVVAAKRLTGPEAHSVRKPAAFAEAIRRALYVSKIGAYAQGFSLMAGASRQYGWNLDLGSIAMIFRGGCIIRAQFLNKIKKAYDKDQGLPSLFLDEYFRTSIENYQKDWREVVVAAIQAGIPVPAFTSSLSYFDSYRAAELPANLLQAQRDYFGAHTFERNDKEGTFHHNWEA